MLWTCVINNNYYSFLYMQSCHGKGPKVSKRSYSRRLKTFWGGSRAYFPVVAYIFCAVTATVRL